MRNRLIARSAKLKLGHSMARGLSLPIIFVAAGAIALHGYSTRLGKTAELDGAHGAVARFIAMQMAETPLDEADRQRQGLVQAALRSSSVLAVGWTDKSGRLAQLNPQVAGLQDSLTLRSPDRAATIGLVLPVGGKPVPIRINYEPLPAITSGESGFTGVALIGRIETGDLAHILGVWRFSVPMIVVSVVGLFLGLWWLRREVIGPLAAVSRSVEEATLLPEALPTDRTDEIGAVARLLLRLKGEAQHWQEKADQIKLESKRRIQEEIKRINEALRRSELKAWTDPLTRLGNRGLLDARFHGLFDAQLESDQDLAAIMLDLDHFKTLNDTLGHRAGDELLRFAGQLLRSVIRPSDVAIRFGGDEFLVLLPSASADDALRVAQRIISLFSQRARLLKCKPYPTFSAGIASLRRHRPNSADEMLSLADSALYQAKRTGKNNAVIHADEPGPAVASTIPVAAAS